LRRSRGFAAVGVVTLALGIGASTAMFSLVDAVVVRPLKYPEPQRLVGLFLSDARPGGLAPPAMSPGGFFAVAAHVPRPSHVAAVSYAGYGLSVSGLGAEPERVDAASVTADYFAALGVAPAIGRAFAAGEDVPGTQATVVVSDALWQRRLGGDRGAI